MTFRDWATETNERVREDGWRGVKESAYEFYVGLWRNVGKRINYGTPIWDEEWDICLVLDACRWDLIPEVDRPYLTNDWKYSVASSSGEWIPKTFDGRDTSDVAYVTANPYSKNLLDASSFALLDEVWEYGFDRDLRTIPADVVTDQALTAWADDPDRMVVHYMQPHHPFVPNPMDQGLPRQEFDSQPWDNVWHKLRKGEVERDEVWDGYVANLEYVLNHVETLLHNADADVLITSDHGNVLGEWGMYAHPDWVPLRSLKRVPWITTRAEDRGDYEPVDHSTREDERIDRDHQLEALGYK
ncbi:hypothetical protein [Halorhabdus sp. CUG00001]|uniref:hypothetical protein n=1 Tax=Halorhabdus sp. CUG00001 TaxID=2600297 RepID=UPI00131DDF9D|nr:hypothetical protein [Halorhabdus sp. CUG00001]